MTSYWKELNQFKDIVYFYKNYKEFEDSLNKALKNDFNDSTKYKKIIEESKWENRLKEYKKHIF